MTDDCEDVSFLWFGTAAETNPSPLRTIRRKDEVRLVSRSPIKVSLSLPLIRQHWLGGWSVYLGDLSLIIKWVNIQPAFTMVRSMTGTSAAALDAAQEQKRRNHNESRDGQHPIDVVE
jgi:hypothetical protein